MLHLFATEVERWRSFSIEFDATLIETLMAILKSSKGQLTNLEELEISFQRELVPVESAVNLFSSLLCLKSLRRMYLNFLLKNSPTFNYQLIPWRQLNDILVRAPLSLEECVRYLSQCSSASRVSLYASPPPSSQAPISRYLPITTLPNLSSLTLVQWWDPAEALRFFKLPSLRHLKLTTENFFERNCNRQPSILKAFLERSQCAIDRLTILDYDMDINAVLEYLKIPGLYTIPRVGFSFEGAGIMILEVLQRNPNAEHPFPRLLAWDCPETEMSFVGWGETDKKMIPKYKWEDRRIAFFST
jgi:hypothetical protein